MMPSSVAAACSSKLKPWQNFLAPRAVDATAERRVQHQLHAARLVEKPFQHEMVHGRHDAERALALIEIADDLLRRGRRQAVVPRQNLDVRFRA